MWIAPKRSTAASASACTCAASVTSVTTPIDLGARVAQLGDRLVERGRLDVAEDDLHALGREAPTPSASPMPLAPPVTTATFAILHGEPAVHRTVAPISAPSVAVVVGLVRARHRHADVVGLLLGERRELHAELVEVQARDLLVEVLRQHVHLASRRSRCA